MPEYEDAFNSELFDDWGSIKPGHLVPEFGSKLRYRQGADIQDWSVCGGQKYVPGSWQMQAGAAKDIFTARSNGAFEIDFPVPFGDSPLFLATITATLPAFTECSALMCAVQSASTMEVYWWSAANITRIYINWLAIGPVGLNV